MSIYKTGWPWTLAPSLSPLISAFKANLKIAFRRQWLRQTKTKGTGWLEPLIMACFLLKPLD